MMIRFLLPLLFIFSAYGQAPTKEIDHQLVASDYFADEYPEDNICKVKLKYLDDVKGTFSDGQCIGYRGDDDSFIGRTCGSGGGSGFDFTSALADTNQEWILPVELRRHTVTALYDFITATCPSGWGTNCWSVEATAVRGSVTNGPVDSNVVLISNTEVAYSATATKKVKNIWVGNTKHPVSVVTSVFTLGTRDVTYSTITTPLVGSNWQNVKLEFDDGSFAPSATDNGLQRTANKKTLLEFLGLSDFTPTPANTYPATKEIIKAGRGISATPSDTNNTITVSTNFDPDEEDQFIALDTLPTNLSSYDDKQVLRINNPAPGSWQEIEQLTASGHALKLNTTIDTQGSVENIGINLIGSGKHGSVETVEGTALTENNSPLLRFIVQHDPGGPGLSDDEYTVEVLIRKSAIPTSNQGITPLYLSVYDGVPGHSTFEDAYPLAKQADRTIDGIEVQEYTLTFPNQTRYSDFKANQQSNATMYIELYRSFVAGYNPAADVFDVLQEKQLKEIDKPVDFTTSELDTTKRFKLVAEEQTVGVKQDKDLALVASGSNYIINNPFDGVSRLTFNGTSSATSLYNRYSVNVPVHLVLDNDAPTVLEVGTKQFPLSYFSTEGQVAIYRTNFLVPNDRVTSAGTIRSVNIQRRDGTWYGNAGVTNNFKTITKAQLVALSGQATVLHTIPNNPQKGQHVELLANTTVSNPGTITVSEQSSVNSWGWFGTLGSLLPAPGSATIVGVLAYSSSGSNNTNLRSRIAIQRATGNSRTPTQLVLNGVEYALSTTPGLSHFFRTGSNTSQFLQQGRKYSLNVKYSDNTKLYPDLVLQAGQTYVFDGIRWLKTAGPSEAEVDARIDAKVPRQFRNDADTSGQYFQPKCWWEGTEAQYNALSPKIAGCIYNRY